MKKFWLFIVAIAALNYNAEAALRGLLHNQGDAVDGKISKKQDPQQALMEGMDDDGGCPYFVKGVSEQRHIASRSE